MVKRSQRFEYFREDAVAIHEDVGSLGLCDALHEVLHVLAPLALVHFGRLEGAAVTSGL